MRDLELRGDPSLHGGKHFVVQSMVAENRMYAHSIHSRSERPNVQVMDAGDPGDAGNGVSQSREVDV